MGLYDGYEISTSGMSAQRTRLNVVSANIANAQTTNTQEGGPYKKQNVIFEEVLLQQQRHPVDTQQASSSISKVGVKDVVDAKTQPIMKYEPSHPNANDEGYVAYPNINPVIEMVDLIEAIRSYEANTKAFSAHKDIDTKTLDILKA